MNPDLLVFVKDSEVVGCCLLVWRTQWVKGVPLRRVYLNCGGEDEADSTCMEYNSLLSLPDYAEEVAKALETSLRGRHWDELLLQGVVEHSPIYAMASSLGSLELSERPSHYVDLCQLRRDAVDFDCVLSAKARKNIRRSQRTFDQIGGTCTVRLAESAEEAVTMLRQLAELHQTSWVDRGSPGVFGSQRFFGFHESLIHMAFSKNRILLFQVRTGAELVGALYCFLDRGWVRFYQSGFNYSLDEHASPGLFTLYLIIRYCLDQQDFMAFDFLAGDTQYKRSLATSSQSLRWVSVLRPTPTAFAFRGLRAVKRMSRHFFGSGTSMLADDGEGKDK